MDARRTFRHKSFQRVPADEFIERRERAEYRVYHRSFVSVRAHFVKHHLCIAELFAVCPLRHVEWAYPFPVIRRFYKFFVDLRPLIRQVEFFYFYAVVLDSVQAVGHELHKVEIHLVVELVMRGDERVRVLVDRREVGPKADRYPVNGFEVNRGAHSLRLRHSLHITPPSRVNSRCSRRCRLQRDRLRTISLLSGKQT